ncbi:MAG: hypothetical protein WC807_09995 [Hyphomicrobium sp.]
MRDPANIIIVVLAIAVAALVYFYVIKNREGGSIEAPGIKLETK